MYSLLTVADMAPPAVWLGLVVGALIAILASVMTVRYFTKSHNPRTCVTLFSGAPLVPVSAGLISVRVPTNYRFGWKDGNVIVEPRNARGIFVVIGATLVIDDGEEKPTQSYIETWADQNDGTVAMKDGVVIATATRDDDGQGEQLELHQVVRGEGVVITTLDFHIDKRHARKGAIQRTQRDLKTMMDGLQVNIRRQAMHTPNEQEQAYLYEANSLSVTPVDRKDQELIDKLLAKGRMIVESYLAKKHTERITHNVLDWVLMLWQTDVAEDKPKHHDFALAMGALFGDHCIRTLELRWGATFVDGSRQIVLRHAPTNLVVFPFQAVTDQFQSMCFLPLFTAISSFVAMKQSQPVA